MAEKPNANQVPLRTLVVDSDDLILTLIKSYLSGVGAPEVDGFKKWFDAKSAIVAGEKVYDLIVIDWKSKTPPGAEIFKEIREMPETVVTPVILISGQITKDDVGVIRQYPTNTNFLVKPFTEEVFLTTVSKTHPGAHPKKKKKQSKMSIVQGGALKPNTQSNQNSPQVKTNDVLGSNNNTDELTKPTASSTKGSSNASYKEASINLGSTTSIGKGNDLFHIKGSGGSADRGLYHNKNNKQESGSLYVDHNETPDASKGLYHAKSQGFASDGNKTKVYAQDQKDASGLKIFEREKKNEMVIEEKTTFKNGEFDLKTSQEESKLFEAKQEGPKAANAFDGVFSKDGTLGSGIDIEVRQEANSPTGSDFNDSNGPRKANSDVTEQKKSNDINDIHSTTSNSKKKGVFLTPSLTIEPNHYSDPSFDDEEMIDESAASDLAMDASKQGSFSGVFGSDAKANNQTESTEAALERALFAGLSGPDTGTDTKDAKGIANTQPKIDDAKGESGPNRNLSNPLVEPQFDADPDLALLDMNTPREPNNFKSGELALRSAMVVDADKASVLMVSNYLKEIGCPLVYTADDGASAWKKIKEVKPEIIVMDWKLRTLSSIALYNRIRKDQELFNTPVIIVSGFVKKQDFRLLEESGATIYLEKPFSIEVFDRNLVTFVKKHRDLAVQMQKVNKFIEDGIHDHQKSMVEILLVTLNKFDAPLPAILAAGEYLFQKKRYLDAERAYQMALRIHYDNAMVLTALAKVYHKLNKSAAAYKLLSKAEGLSPQNVERLCLLGEVGLTLQEPDRAREYFKKALLIDQSDKTAVAGLSLVENMKDFFSLFEHQPKPGEKGIASILNIVGITLVRNKDFAKGIEQYNAALSLVDENSIVAKILFNLGLAYLRSKNYEQAQEYFLRARSKADKDFKKPDEFLARVEAYKQLPRGQRLMIDDEVFELVDEEPNPSTLPEPIDPMKRKRWA